MHNQTPSNEVEATLASIKQRLEEIVSSQYIVYDEYEAQRNEGRSDLAQDLLDEFFKVP